MAMSITGSHGRVVASNAFFTSYRWIAPRTGGVRTLAAVATFAVASAALGDNGLSLIGTGAESVAMGGADVAVARDTTALSTNPAGLSQVHGWALDAFGAAAFATDVTHLDQYGNDKFVSNRVMPLLGNGLSKQIDGSPLALGVGLFAQAGAGNVYNKLNTPFSGSDTMRAQFGVIKLTPGLSWQINDAVSIGASLNIYYASFTQRIFPNTSTFNPINPAQTYFGTEIKGASTVRVGGKFGAMWKATPDLKFGATYSLQTDLPFDNGKLIANMSAIGLGNVTYNDVQLRGLALPAEVAAGVAWQATPRLLLALDVQYADYSRAVRSQTLSASNPDNAHAPPSISNTASLNWHDQAVFAAGLEYKLDDATRLYGGINYGRNPIPADKLDPLLAAIGELHLTGGFGHRLDAQWDLMSALEYLVPNHVTYDNPQLPFGPGARESISYLAVYVMLSRRW